MEHYRRDLSAAQVHGTGTGYSGAVSLPPSGSRTETGNAAWVGYASTCTWTATGEGGSATFSQTMTTSPVVLTVASPVNNVIVPQGSAQLFKATAVFSAQTVKFFANEVQVGGTCGR